MSLFKKKEKKNKEPDKYFNAGQAIYDYCVNILKMTNPKEITFRCYMQDVHSIFNIYSITELTDIKNTIHINNCRRYHETIFIIDYNEIEKLIKNENINKIDIDNIKIEVREIVVHVSDEIIPTQISIKDNGIKYANVKYEDLCENVNYINQHCELSQYIDYTKYLTEKPFYEIL